MSTGNNSHVRHFTDVVRRQHNLNFVFFYFRRRPRRILARCSAGLLGIPVIFYPTPGRVCGSGCESRTRRSRQVRQAHKFFFGLRYLMEGDPVAFPTFVGFLFPVTSRHRPPSFWAGLHSLPTASNITMISSLMSTTFEAHGRSSRCGFGLAQS